MDRMTVFFLGGAVDLHLLYIYIHINYIIYIHTYRAKTYLHNMYTCRCLISTNLQMINMISAGQKPSGSDRPGRQWQGELPGVQTADDCYGK